MRFFSRHISMFNLTALQQHLVDFFNQGLHWQYFTWWELSRSQIHEFCSYIENRNLDRIQKLSKNADKPTSHISIFKLIVLKNNSLNFPTKLRVESSGLVDDSEFEQFLISYLTLNSDGRYCKRINFFWFVDFQAHNCRQIIGLNSSSEVLIQLSTSVFYQKFISLWKATVICLVNLYCAILTENIAVWRASCFTPNFLINHPLTPWDLRSRRKSSMLSIFGYSNLRPLEICFEFLFRNSLLCRECSDKDSTE